MNKKTTLFAVIFATLIFSSFISVFSQQASDSKFSIGSDFYSAYIWRGSRFGTGPAIQPAVKYTGEYLTAGAWGSFDFSGYQEADLYFSVSLPAGISFGMTDYYYPGLQYNDFSGSSGSHAYEINAGFSGWNFSMSANYVVNEAGGAGSLGGDKYFQAGYSFKFFNLFIGAGDGWHTYDPETGNDKFAVCNLGIGITNSIRVTDSFSIPVNGQVIFNPDKEQMFLVVGFTIEP